LIRILQGIGGVVVIDGFSHFFDLVVYPIVLVGFGFWGGTAALFLFWVVMNFILISLYDLIKKDLFGLEALKELKASMSAEKPKGFWKTLLYKTLRWGDIPFFVAISTYDPIFAVLYKRKTTNFGGFEKRDYWILVLSTATGCFLWSLIWTGAIEIIKSFF
jgi:hypothetical protein